MSPGWVVGFYGGHLQVYASAAAPERAYSEWGGGKGRLR